MRDCGKVQSWTDYLGRSWRVVQSGRRLKFKYPAHAALRAHVFHRDGYRCCRCEAKALEVPVGYDGRDALWTDTFVSSGWRDLLILDHIVTLKAGGRSIVTNLQTLCETCNKHKIREDNITALAYREGLAA